MRVIATLAGALLFAFPVFAKEDEDPVIAVLKSAGAKGGEVAAKALAGLLYDTSCKNVNLDAATGYVCQVLGSVSGRAEDEWKENVTKQLEQISTRLETIESGQRQIQRDLARQHEEVNAKFDQVATNVVAVKALVDVEGLWEKYKAQFDRVDQDVTADSMVSFAREIMKAQPHTILTNLNVVLTRPPEGQPLLRYPFYEWRAKSGVILADRLEAESVYDFAEKKFVEYRMRQQKAYVMYLWAAAVLESQCKLKPAQCKAPPRSTADFRADYDRYTRQQIEAFNVAVDWFLLSYSNTRQSSAPTFLPSGATGIFLRANYLTSTILGNGEGLWGRVISMGNAWDGSLQVTCGGAAQTLTPAFKYTAPVGGSGHLYSGPDSGPLDWWVASKGDTTYDEVRFSDNWQIYHYSIPAAKPGRCVVWQKLPKGGMLPWVQPETKVATVQSGGQSFPFGSFVAIQRAGGAYALLSGAKWSGMSQPERSEDGLGQREKVVYEWFIEPDHPTGPAVGLYMKGRGEFRVLKRSSRIHNRDKIVLRQNKEIRFPDDRMAKFNFYPGGFCKGQLCADGGSTSILQYDVTNNDTESKKGKLDAIASVSFRDTSNPSLETGQGVHVDRSYGKTGDRKQVNVDGVQRATIQTQPNRKYQLTYYIYFDLETEGRGIDATEYMYRALLAPGTMFLSAK